MRKVFQAAFVLGAMVLSAWQAAAEVNLDNFFEAAAKISTGSMLASDLDQATVTKFKARYAANATRLELDTCHAVYKLIGTLAAQIETGFQTLAQAVLKSFETDKGLLFTLTGYSWSTTETAKDKDAEVVGTLRKVEWLQKNKAEVNTVKGVSLGSQDPDPSFFGQIVFAVSALTFLDHKFLSSTSNWNAFATWSDDVKKFYSNCFFVANFPLVRFLAAGRFDLAEDRIQSNVQDLESLASYMTCKEVKEKGSKEKEFLLSKIPALNALEKINDGALLMKFFNSLTSWLQKNQ